MGRGFTCRCGYPEPLLPDLVVDEGSQNELSLAALHESANGRFCCKSLFALVIKIAFRCTRDFRVKMWGTSSPEDKLAGDLGNVIEAISNRRSSGKFFTTGKLAGNLGLFQQHRPNADYRLTGYSITSSASASSVGGT